MAEFGLIKSFDVDDGQLDGISPQQCFVLGYELAQVDGLLAQPDAFTRIVHAENADRIRFACREAKLQFRLTWMEGDKSETWMWLEVGAP
jgi:hypothetical protein